MISPTCRKGFPSTFYDEDAFLDTQHAFSPLAQTLDIADGGCYLAGIASLLIVKRPLIDPRACNAERRAEVQKSILVSLKASQILVKSVFKKFVATNSAVKSVVY